MLRSSVYYRPCSPPLTRPSPPYVCEITMTLQEEFHTTRVHRLTVHRQLRIRWPELPVHSHWCTYRTVMLYLLYICRNFATLSHPRRARRMPYRQPPSARHEGLKSTARRPSTPIPSPSHPHLLWGGGVGWGTSYTIPSPTPPPQLSCAYRNVRACFLCLYGGVGEVWR
jgi:hypothetical protein